jgi:hypothetical protein
MKTLHKLTIVAAFLGLSVLAAPTRGPQVTITLLNEIDRHSGAASIPADGRFRRVPDLFATTDLDQNGQFFGTSAQLTQFEDDTHCLIRGIDGDIQHGFYWNFPETVTDGSSNDTMQSSTCKYHAIAALAVPWTELADNDWSQKDDHDKELRSRVSTMSRNRIPCSIIAMSIW